MKIKKLKEQEREKIAELLCQSKIEYSKYYRMIEDNLNRAKTEEERNKILNDPLLGGNNFSASFLQSNGLTFKIVAYYQDLGSDVYRCSHCHTAPVATFDNNWAFTKYCGSCGAKMENAEELQKKQREKMNIEKYNK